MGYRPLASFKSEMPIFAADVFHAVNPEIVVFERISNQADRREILSGLGIDAQKPFAKESTVSRETTAN